MEKSKFTFKDVIYILIIIILLILLILSKIDFKINFINKDNWVDIIIGSVEFLGSTILSILIIYQGYKINHKEELLETKMFNKQLDMELRERRLNVYSEFMILGVIGLDNIKNSMINNFISANHEQNKIKYEEILEKERRITKAYCEAKLLFNDDKELVEYLGNLFNLFIEYRFEINKFMGNFYVANEEAIKLLKNEGYSNIGPWIPKEIILEAPEEYEKCVKIFELYYSDVLKKEKEISKIIASEKLDTLFQKYINIKKMEI